MLEGDASDALSADESQGANRVTVGSTDAPTLSFVGAIERLDAGTEPHVFFRNAATRRGNVVYRRYDGHYGVITPSGEG